MIDLVVEKIYRRRDLHFYFGGQRQGGISTPANHPVILLFTGFTGLQHGYEDGWSDGVFCFLGEGQVGDMPWLRGNASVKDHVKTGKDLFLFQMLQKPRSHVKFLGIFSAASWEYRQSPDINQDIRTAIVFHLVPTPTALPELSDSQTLPDLSALRAAAIAAGNETPDRKTKQALTTYIERCVAIRDYALARSNGRCECCTNNAPFTTAAGTPFLEVHHIRRLTPDQVYHPPPATLIVKPAPLGVALQLLP